MYNQFIFKFGTPLHTKSINELSAPSITVNVQNHGTYMTFQMMI